MKEQTENSELPGVILNTVRYFDLFDQPVTVVQLWQMQIAATQTWSLHEVQIAAEGLLLTKRLEREHGFYCLPQRAGIFRVWLRRHALAQQKWKLTRRIVVWLACVPFVRMIAMSGSLAAGNTRPTSDLDLFVVVQHGRIWVARLGLLVITQLLGRRRRYWDRQAPDKVCLNHYVTDDSLLINPEIRNVYTAVLYRSLISLVGHEFLSRFWAVNKRWLIQQFRSPQAIQLVTRHAVQPSPSGHVVRGSIEGLLHEPLWDWLERGAEWMQRAVIGRHTAPGQPGRIVISDRELAFHPNTKVPGLLARYYQ